jgi:hypothetical protein
VTREPEGLIMRKHDGRLSLGAVVGLAAVGVVVVLLAAVGIAGAGDGALPPDLQEVRVATARYHSWAQAERDGYWIRPGEPCVASPLGTMGVHAINLQLMADPALDARRPEILLYLPDGNGNLKLIGVEYWREDADQSLGTNDDRPSLFGRPFEGPMPGHGNWGMPVHYDLHVWVAEENSSGVFAQFNPDFACPSSNARTMPGDTAMGFWPHETGTDVGTSETYADVREDGSYYDPSLGRRISLR